jgi:hypothetical protein
MSKLQEKIEFYSKEATELGIAFQSELLEKVTKGLGPSIYQQDSETVSCSDETELATVKNNFLIKKLGLEDSPELDAALLQKFVRKWDLQTKTNTELFSIIYW